jgi:hypothetical protein
MRVQALHAAHTRVIFQANLMDTSPRRTRPPGSVPYGQSDNVLSARRDEAGRRRNVSVCMYMCAYLHVCVFAYVRTL